MKHMGRILCFAGALCACSGGGEGEEVDSRSSLSVRTDQGANVPFYARLERGSIYHDIDWAIVAFYRPPSCVPTSFNMIDFMDYAAFSCVPLTVKGFDLWSIGPGQQPVPYHVTLWGLGAVPLWLVDWPALEAAIADDVITIAELQALPHLEGLASKYHEVLHPNGTAKVGLLEATASGSLMDGRSFSVKILQHHELGRLFEVHVTID